MHCAALGCLVLFGMVAHLQAQKTGEPPVQKGALPVGNCRRRVTATPTEVEVGERVTVTLRISAKPGEKCEEPLRPNLARLYEDALDPQDALKISYKLTNFFYLEPPADAGP